MTIHLKSNGDELEKNQNLDRKKKSVPSSSFLLVDLNTMDPGSLLLVQLSSFRSLMRRFIELLPLPLASSTHQTDLIELNLGAIRFAPGHPI